MQDDNIESVPGLPSYDQVRRMVHDLYDNTCTAHAETWCMILFRLMTRCKSCVLFPLVCATYELKWKFPYNMTDEWLNRDVNPDDAYRMGLSCHTMPLESALTLHTILHACEWELGSDHADMQPIHRLRSGLRERAQMIARGIDLEDMTIE